MLKEKLSRDFMQRAKFRASAGEVSTDIAPLKGPSWVDVFLQEEWQGAQLPKNWAEFP